MDDEEFAAWFRLIETPGLSRAAARALLGAFGSPEAVLRASPAQWRAVAGPGAADALMRPAPAFQERLDAAQRWRHGGDRRTVLPLGDPDYPPALLQTADPPLMLYLIGQRSALRTAAEAGAIAIVGSRSPTAQGRDNAFQFARHFASLGHAVVSGLAIGIDAAAHEGALAAGGITIAVVATGLDQVYPRQHRDLARRIAEGGALIGEFAPGMPGLRENFPQRNRIIAGVSRGTLVVEAALQSGSLITARLAAEAGREVFAIPGSIHTPQARGCHWLIKQGAKLVESAADVLDELGGAAALASPAAADPPAPEDALLAALGHEPTSLDALCARTGEAAPILAARLLEYELAGHVARLPGGLYQRRASA
jgi:DNA processing protein